MPPALPTPPHTPHKPKGWKAFLYAYAAGAVLTLLLPGHLPTGTDLIVAAFTGLPFGLIGYVAFGLLWPAWEAIARLRTAEGGWKGALQRARPVNWARIVAAVLSSNLFFLASCTGGMFVGMSVFDGTESGLHHGVERPIDPGMAVVALVPKPGSPGQTQVVQTPLRELERFRKENPDHSFRIPAGRGEIADASRLVRTGYSATAAGPDKVLVETKYTLDEIHVDARYEATDRAIRPLSTKTSHDMVTFMAGVAVGIPLAVALALVGKLLGWWTRRKAG